MTKSERADTLACLLFLILVIFRSHWHVMIATQRRGYNNEISMERTEVFQEEIFLY